MKRHLLIALPALALLLGCKDKPAGAASLPPGAVEIRVGEDGFKPSAVTFKKGAPASLVFLRTSDDTCATAVDFPELGVKKELPKGKPVTIEIPTDKDRRLTFQCGMGMYKSSVVVN